MSTRRLVIRAQLDSHSGYGLALCHLFEELQKLGIFVTFRPTGTDTSHGTRLPTQMMAQITQPRQPEKFELTFYPPTIAPTPDRKTVWFNMWESSRLAPMNVSLLNRADCVVVPSEWNKEAYKKSGVTRPIYVCNLGFDPTIFAPSPTLQHGPTIFGIAGRTAHCSARKMVQEAIDLWVSTFRNEEDVRLWVKVHPTDQIKVPNDKRIRVTREVLEEHEIAHWLRGLTAYINLARCEGWGMWTLQAIACGRPTITCRHSGHSEFVTADNSFLIAFDEISASGHGDSNVSYLGTWAQPNMNNAAVVMQGIHRNRSAALEKAAKCAESVAHLTWANSAAKLVKILSQRKVWSS